MIANYPLAFLWLALVATSAKCDSIVQFNVDAGQDIRPISRFIYGINQFHGVLDGMEGPYSNLTFTRLGGNRLTAYNWTNNASNAGSDYLFQSDNYLVDGPMFKDVASVPGGACIPIVDTARRIGAAVLLTVPINGYVAADTLGNGDVKKSGPDYLTTRFKPESPRKNAPFTLNPDPSAPVVFQDEFVNWAKTKYPDDPNSPIWFSLDNEPDWWSKTHPEIHPKLATYEELISKDTAYAAAVKDVMGQALVFGAVNYGWMGYKTLQLAPDGNGRDFLDFYLQSMADAEKTAGRRLLDVLDVHWYPEARSNGVRVIGENTTTAPAVNAARMAAPRSLWDPAYVEDSWITKDSTKGPIRLIPRLKDKIDKFYPGTKLSISEYYFGEGKDISGGIAQADVLGIFGREGLFAAALWPEDNIPFIGGAFEMFRNFDGKNSVFGDLSVRADTADIDKTSIYASKDSRDPGRMTIVLINKTDQSISANVKLTGADDLQSGQAYQLTAAAPDPKPAGQVEIGADHSLSYVMPEFSVTTLELSNQARRP